MEEVATDVFNELNDTLDGDELEDAIRLSMAVHKGQEERKKEEEAIHRLRLIKEQNREYNESLLLDKLKEEQQLAAEQEEKKYEQTEKEKKQKLQELLLQMKDKSLTLPPEPAKGLSDTAELVVRLPDGKRATRRFYKGNLIRHVKDWVDSELGKKDEEERRESEQQPEGERKELTTAASFLVQGYDLVTDFPRVVFADLNQSLEEAKLHPRALLNISLR